MDGATGMHVPEFPPCKIGWSGVVMRWTIRFRSLAGGPEATPASVSPQATDGYGNQDPGAAVAIGTELAPTRQAVVPLFVLFTISGVTGLIYESLWSHYLMLFLGHA